MKRFFIWLSIFLVINILISSGLHFYLKKNPKKIIIAVDTSYKMSSNWSKVIKYVERYGNKRYTKYALITDKFILHSWEDKVISQKLNNIKSYGIRELEIFYNDQRYKEIKEADLIYVLTDDNNFQIKDPLKYKLILIK